MGMRIYTMSCAAISLRKWGCYGIASVIVMTSALADEIDSALVEAWETEVRCHFGGPAWVTAPPPVDIDWQSFTINEKGLVPFDASVPVVFRIRMYSTIKAFHSSTQLLGSTRPELNKVILAYLNAGSSAYPEMLAMILCDRLGIDRKPLIRKHFGTDNMHDIDKAVLKEFWGRDDMPE